ncbi:MAG: hypothetical protein OHK0029_00530 [Armatimonadaceae bacterium]
MLSHLPKLTSEQRKPTAHDWLVQHPKERTLVGRGDHAEELLLTNGLIERVWRVSPNVATVGFRCLTTGESFLRGVKPEARVSLDGKVWEVGGLAGQPDYAYLRPEWLDSLTAIPYSFRCVAVRTRKAEPVIAWKQVRYAGNRTPLPNGVRVELDFMPPAETLPGLRVTVHYEMYDGLPLIAKWMTLTNGGDRKVHLDTFQSEVLAVPEVEAFVEDPERWEYPGIHVESDYAFHGMDPKSASKTVYWVPDPQYATQVNYNRKTPNLLECRPPLGPDVDILPGETFTTFRTYEMLFDSTDRERRGLALRRMYRALAPWVTENPILMHVRSKDPQVIRNAIDQCAEVGFEMVILSFGSGFDMESEDPQYRRQIRELVEYGQSKGVELGGYSLLASRRISDEHDVIHPETRKTGGAIFGNSPCLCSRWGQDYFRKLRSFIEDTGLRVLEHDGSYPGDVCASESHPGHRGLGDSQWRQWEQISRFYRWCRESGVYLNVPDWYFLNGSSKTGMGYRETNWSLPREQQFVLARQNIYDGTWYKTPSMGWMFVPLVEYHGGGAAATLEPLHDHRDAYGKHLAQNFAAGVQACYRGERLYDTPETRAVVKQWVDFYKKYRALLDSDVIHLGRPDGQSLDGLLHVNPDLPQKGFAVLHNPRSVAIETVVRLPLYYTGLRESAKISLMGENPRKYTLDREYRVEVPVQVPAGGMVWMLIE